MPRVELTPHLYRYFPALETTDLAVDAATVREVVAAIDRIAPGLASYITDERGAMRPHVNVFVGEHVLVDRQGLSDPVPADARVSIFQALSGG
jgi:sulfur-carrier protein